MLSTHEGNDVGSNPTWGVKGLKNELRDFLRAIFLLKRTLHLVYLNYLREKRASITIMLPRAADNCGSSFYAATIQIPALLAKSTVFSLSMINVFPASIAKHAALTCVIV